MKLIDKAAVVAEIEKRKNENLKCETKAGRGYFSARAMEDVDILSFIDTLEMKEGKQIIIITESDGDAHIHWDCRSLEDVNTLLDCAKSFIIDRQIEDVRGKGSFPDYNTEEGRYKDLFSKSSEVKEVDFSTEIYKYIDEHFNVYDDGNQTLQTKDKKSLIGRVDVENIAKHFFELGLHSTITEEDCKLIWNIGDEIPNMPEDEFFKELLRRYKAQKGE